MCAFHCALRFVCEAFVVDACACVVELVLQLIVFPVHDVSCKVVRALMHGCASDDMRFSFSAFSTCVLHVV